MLLQRPSNECLHLTGYCREQKLDKVHLNFNTPWIACRAVAYATAGAMRFLYQK